MSSGFWVSARYICVALAGIVTTTAFARLASKETLGQYQYVLSILAIFSVFSLPGLNMAAMKAVGQKNHTGVLDAVAKSFWTSLFAVPFLFIYAVYLFQKGDYVVSMALAASTLLFPFFYAPNTWYAYYEGQSLFKPVAIRVVTSTILVTAVLVLGLYSKFDVVWLVCLYLAVSSLFSLYFYFEVRNAVKRTTKKSAKEPLDTKYGQRVTAQKFVYTMSESLPPITVGLLLGTVAVASFQVANVFLSGVSGLIGALAAISVPHFFTDLSSNHRNVFWQNVIIGILASIGYWVVIELIFMRIYGAQYTESFLLARSLVALPFLVSLRMFLVNYLTSRDKNYLIITSYLVANTVALGIFIYCSHRFSFSAAAASYLYALNILIFLPLAWAYFYGKQNQRSE